MELRLVIMTCNKIVLVADLYSHYVNRRYNKKRKADKKNDNVFVPIENTQQFTYTLATILLVTVMKVLHTFHST